MNSDSGFRPGDVVLERTENEEYIIQDILTPIGASYSIFHLYSLWHEKSKEVADQMASPVSLQTIKKNKGYMSPEEIRRDINSKMRKILNSDVELLNFMNSTEEGKVLRSLLFVVSDVDSSYYDDKIAEVVKAVFLGIGNVPTEQVVYQVLRDAISPDVIPDEYLKTLARSIDTQAKGTIGRSRGATIYKVGEDYRQLKKFLFSDASTPDSPKTQKTLFEMLMVSPGKGRGLNTKDSNYFDFIVQGRDPNNSNAKSELVEQVLKRAGIIGDDVSVSGIAATEILKNKSGIFKLIKAHNPNSIFVMGGSDNFENYMNYIEKVSRSASAKHSERRQAGVDTYGKSVRRNFDKTMLELNDGVVKITENDLYNQLLTRDGFQHNYNPESAKSDVKSEPLYLKSSTMKKMVEEKKADINQLRAESAALKSQHTVPHKNTLLKNEIEFSSGQNKELNFKPLDFVGDEGRSDFVMSRSKGNLIMGYSPEERETLRKFNLFQSNKNNTFTGIDRNGSVTFSGNNGLEINGRLSAEDNLKNLQDYFTNNPNSVIAHTTEARQNYMSALSGLKVRGRDVVGSGEADALWNKHGLNVETLSGMLGVDGKTSGSAVEMAREFGTVNVPVMTLSTRHFGDHLYSNPQKILNATTEGGMVELLLENYQGARQVHTVPIETFKNSYLQDISMGPNTEAFYAQSDRLVERRLAGLNPFSLNVAETGYVPEAKDMPITSPQYKLILDTETKVNQLLAHPDIKSIRAGVSQITDPYDRAVAIDSTIASVMGGEATNEVDHIVKRRLSEIITNPINRNIPENITNSATWSFLQEQSSNAAGYQLAYADILSQVYTNKAGPRISVMPSITLRSGSRNAVAIPLSGALTGGQIRSGLEKFTLNAIADSALPNQTGATKRNADLALQMILGGMEESNAKNFSDDISGKALAQEFEARGINTWTRKPAERITELQKLVRSGTEMGDRIRVHMDNFMNNGGIDAVLNAIPQEAREAVRYGMGSDRSLESLARSIEDNKHLIEPGKSSIDLLGTFGDIDAHVNLAQTVNFMDEISQKVSPEELNYLLDGIKGAKQAGDNPANFKAKLLEAVDKLNAAKESSPTGSISPMKNESILAGHTVAITSAMNAEVDRFPFRTSTFRAEQVAADAMGGNLAKVAGMGMLALALGVKPVSYGPESAPFIAGQRQESRDMSDTLADYSGDNYRVDMKVTGRTSGQKVMALKAAIFDNVSGQMTTTPHNDMMYMKSLGPQDKRDYFSKQVENV